MDEQIAQDVIMLKKMVTQLQKNRRAPNYEHLTDAEAAEQIGCSTKTLQKHEKEGRIVPEFPNAAKRWHPDVIEKFMRGMVGRKR